MTNQKPKQHIKQDRPGAPRKYKSDEDRIQYWKDQRKEQRLKQFITTALNNYPDLHLDINEVVKIHKTLIEGSKRVNTNSVNTAIRLYIKKSISTS